jgi:hypothetical protein
MARIAKSLQKWALDALELGFGCFSDGDRTPFILLIDQNGKRHLIDLKTVSGKIDESILDQGRNLIRGLKPARMYALVWDGYLVGDDIKQDAVFAEAGQMRGARAYIFAQPYKQKKPSKKLEKLGPPFVAFEATHLWRSKKRLTKKTASA